MLVVYKKKIHNKIVIYQSLYEFTESIKYYYSTC